MKANRSFPRIGRRASRHGGWCTTQGEKKWARWVYGGQVHRAWVKKVSRRFFQKYSPNCDFNRSTIVGTGIEVDKVNILELPKHS
jgi:hypothetical protein